MYRRTKASNTAQGVHFTIIRPKSLNTASGDSRGRPSDELNAVDCRAGEGDADQRPDEEKLDEAEEGKEVKEPGGL